MKPEYGDTLADLDVLILGGYYGQGASMRGEGISTFLCGLYDVSNKRYHSFCTVGTGYSHAELSTLRERLTPCFQPWGDGGHHLAHWEVKKRDDRPDVYIEPEHSVVLQVKCAEVIKSLAYSAGYTCRFPRVQRIRYDKSYQEIMTLQEMLAIVEK
jgi:DNA ligase-4